MSLTRLVWLIPIERIHVIRIIIKKAGRLKMVCTPGVVPAAAVKAVGI